MVLEAFVSSKPQGYEVEHKDGDRSNNALENLSWQKKQPKSRILHRNTKLNEVDIETIRAMTNSGITLQQISNWFGISKSQASKIKNSKP
jgi:hypothetical protein